MLGARHRRRHASSCTPPSAATSSRRCSSSAGRPRTSPATSTARRTRSTLDEDGWALRPYQREAVESLLARRLRRRRAALRRRQDARRRGRDGPGQGDHADPGHQHGLRPAVEGRAAQAHLADRGRDRRVLRRRKEIRPVTIATYQVMTTRRKGVYPHLELFDARDWGLIVYDEVHLLPAPIFRMTADLQARRRLGLTATLVREDGREGDVFSLIGPKRYDAPWKDIEAQGYIAPADCVEVRVTLTDARAARLRDRRARGALPARARAPRRQDRGRPRRWSQQHAGEPTLVIGQYIDQLDELGRAARRAGDQGRDPGQGARAAVRRVPHRRDRRCSWSARSRTSRSTCPEATVAIQVSGTFGSRQEEAQRLGRVLRPKADGRSARFYTVVARDTVDAGLRAAPAAVPRRAGLRLPDRRRRRPARRRLEGAGASLGQVH